MTPCGHSPEPYHVRDGVTVSHQDRHHLQQEAASAAGLADLPTPVPPAPPTKAPCPPGTGPHLRRTGSGSGSSWRQNRSRCWGPKVCRRPESVLEKGRLGVCLPRGRRPSRGVVHTAPVQVGSPRWPRPGRWSLSAGGQTPREPHCAAFSGALLADLQSPRKRALPRDEVPVHPSRTFRDGGE